jgi:hypothetical protein
MPAAAIIIPAAAALQNLIVIEGGQSGDLVLGGLFER